MLDLREQALEQVAISRRKNSKRLAWGHAEEAVDLARQAGVDVDFNILGGGRYPELDILEGLVKAIDEYVIVTRHQGMVDWLAEHGISGEVIPHATEDDIRGKNVVGVLPLNLACLTASITTVDMPDMPFEARGNEHTKEDMESYGAVLSTYVVRKVK